MIVYSEGRDYKSGVGDGNLSIIKRSVAVKASKTTSNPIGIHLLPENRIFLKRLGLKLKNAKR